MGTHIGGLNSTGNDSSNDNGNTTTTVNTNSSATATASSIEGGTAGGVNGIGASRRRIVWILPRANEVQFEYVKRCESCPRLHDGHYGSGRFCSSRCARRVGGLAKKRMWDLTHGVSADLYTNTATTTATSAPRLVGVRSDVNININREQRSPEEATSTSTTRELLTPPKLKGIPFSMLPVSMPLDKIISSSSEQVQLGNGRRVMLVGRSCEKNTSSEELTPLSGRFTPVAIQPQELEYMRTVSVGKTNEKRPSKRLRIHSSPAKMSISVLLNPS